MTESPAAKQPPPTWLRPTLLLIGLGELTAALGGPGPVLGLSVNNHVLIVAGISAAVGAGVVAMFMVVGNQVRIPIRVTGGAVLIAFIALAAIGQDPTLRAVFWGGLGGLMLIPSLLPWKGTGIAGQ